MVSETQPVECKILIYFHCKNCIDKQPPGVSSAEWAMTQAGWTQDGLQVWCNRCEKSVIELDFMGQKMRAR